MGRELGQFSLDLQAGRASPALLCHQTTKGTFVALAMMRQLPRLDRAQSHRQSRGFGERALIIMEYLRANQGFDQSILAIGSAISRRSVGLLVPWSSGFASPLRGERSQGRWPCAVLFWSSGPVVLWSRSPVVLWSAGLRQLLSNYCLHGSNL